MDYDTDVSTKVVRVNRTYNVYRGTSPSTQNRLEVSVVCPLLSPAVVLCHLQAFVKKKEKNKGKRKPPLFSWWDKQLNTTILLSLKCISSFLCCDLMHIFSFQCFWITEMKETLISFYYAWRNNIFFLRKIMTFTSDMYECSEKSAAFKLDL